MQKKMIINNENKNVRLNPVSENSDFSVADTTFAKGLAILFLLFHHLFYLKPSLGLMLSTGKTLEFYIANVMKVCVAMFLLLSGYGIYESTKNKAINYFSFMKKNLVKIFMNYWFIWFLFVPFGFFIIGPNFLTKMYYINISKNLLINLFGLQELLMTPSIISAWWFISLIVAFYAVFPILRFLISYSHISAVSTLIISFVMSIHYNSLGLSFFNTSFLSMWLFSFVFGIFIAKYNLFSKLRADLNNNISSKVIKFILYMLLLSGLIYQRMYGTTINGMLIDGILAFVIIMIGYEFISKISFIKKVGINLGIHSFNIFLFHSFIYLRYFKKFTYSFNNPIVIFLVLLSICVVLSILIERLKKLIKFYEFQKYLLK